MENDIRVAVVLRNKKLRNDSADTIVLGNDMKDWNAVEIGYVTPEHDVVLFGDDHQIPFEKLKKRILDSDKDFKFFDRNGNLINNGQDLDLGLMFIKRGSENFTQLDLVNYSDIIKNNKDILEPYVMHTNVDGNRWKNIPFMNDEVIYTVTEEEINGLEELDNDKSNENSTSNKIVHRLTVEVIVDGKVDAVYHYDVPDGKLIDSNYAGLRYNYPGYKLKDEITPFTMQYSFTYELHYVPMYNLDNVIDNSTDRFFTVTINWVLEPIRFKKATIWKHRGKYEESDYNTEGEIPGSNGTYVINNIRYGTIIANPLLAPFLEIKDISNYFPTKIVGNTVINIVLRYTKDVRLKPNEIATFDYSVIKFSKNGGYSADGLNIIKDANYVIPDQTFKNESIISIRFKWLTNRSDQQRIEITIKYEFDDDAPDYNVSIDNIISYAYKYGINNNWKIFENTESYRLSVWHNIANNGSTGTSYQLNFNNINRYKEFAQGKMYLDEPGYADTFHVTNASEPNRGKIDFDYAWKYKDEPEKRKKLSIDKNQYFNLKNIRSMYSGSVKAMRIYAISPRWEYLYDESAVVKPETKPAPPPEPPKPNMVNLTINCIIQPFTYNKKRVSIQELTYNPTNNETFNYSIPSNTPVEFKLNYHSDLELVSGNYNPIINISENTTINYIFRYKNKIEVGRYVIHIFKIKYTSIESNKNWVYINSGNASPLNPFYIATTIHKAESSSGRWW